MEISTRDVEVDKLSVTIECRATDKVRVVEVKFSAKVTSNEVLRVLAGFHVQSHVFHIHFTISRQLHKYNTNLYCAD